MCKKTIITLLFASFAILQPMACSSSKDLNTNPTTPNNNENIQPQVAKDSKALSFLLQNQNLLNTKINALHEPKHYNELIKNRLQKALENSENRKTNKNLPLDIRYDDLLSTFYENRNYAPLLIHNNKLIPQANLITEELKNHEQHLIPASALALDRLLPLLDKFPPSTPEEKNNGFALTNEELHTAAIILDEQNDLLSTDKINDIINILINNPQMTRLKNYLQETSETTKDSEQLAETEILILDAWLKFARDLSLGNPNNTTDEEEAFLGNKPTDAQRLELTKQRIANHLITLQKTIEENPDKINELIQNIYPPHNQYKRLLQARTHYQQIIQNGAWTEITPANIKFGKTHSIIPKLKMRLQMENYFKGNIDEIYDEDLKNALLLYKRTHQMEENDELKPAFWKSLNTPAEQRLKQIEVNIKRWHQTFLQNTKHFIYINIPDFYGELWKENQLVHRFAVVVGNSKKQCNPVTKQWEYVNATPLQRAKMLYIEYNPYWNVPQRIEHEEYIPKMQKDPQWLQKNRFEYHTEKGYTVLRQLPGDSNALGRVKFIFPNPHSTFMHDSPLKGLFKYPTRAFSHGCMRVKDPLVLAEIILKNDDKWNKQLQNNLDDMVTRRIVLDDRFDVYTDYYNVRVDDDGLIYFLADPYKFVADTINPPKSKKCKPVEKQKFQRPNPDGTFDNIESNEDVSIDITPTDPA